MYGRFGTCSYTCIFSGSGNTAIHDCHMEIPSFFVSIFTVQSYCHVSVLALCTGVPWRARPEAVLSLIICLTAGRSVFLKHVAACLFLGWAVQFTKGGHTTTLAQVMLSAASGTPQWCTRRLKLALVEYSSISHCHVVTPGVTT